MDMNRRPETVLCPGFWRDLLIARAKTLISELATRSGLSSRG
jgi:hypothetical protein